MPLIIPRYVIDNVVVIVYVHYVLSNLVCKRVDSRLLFIIMVFNACTSTLLGDDRASARGTGLANASVVSSSGIDAYGINPANFITNRLKSYDTSVMKSKPLKLSKESSKTEWEFSVMSVGGGYGSDSTMGFYNNYLKYLTINRETFTNLFTDLNSVLNFRQNVLPNDLTDVNYDFELKWLSVNFFNPKICAINFTVSDKVGLNTNVLGRDQYMPLDFALSFNENGTYNLTDVNLNQSEAIAWWIRKYNIAFAKQFKFGGFLKNLNIGFSGGLVHGFGNVTTYSSSIDISTYGIQQTSGGTHVDSVKGKQNFNVLSSLTDFFADYRDGTESHFTFFPKPAGKGYSFDIGINLQLGDNVQVAASVTEIGKITWDYNTIINYDTNSFVYRDFVLSSSDPTYNRFVDDLDGFDTRDTSASFKTNMPTKYRAGIMYRVNKNLMFELDWVKGENNLPSNTTRNIVSLGAEHYVLKYLPLRAGISLGGPEEFNVALGAGLRTKYFELDIATNGINHILNNSRFSAAVSTRFSF